MARDALAVSISLMILFALALHSQLAVGADGYTVTGFWSSEGDYQDRALSVPWYAVSVNDITCSDGVEQLPGIYGIYRFRVPEGVSSFRCREV